MGSWVWGGGVGHWWNPACALVQQPALWLFMSGNTAFLLVSQLARQFGPRRGWSIGGVCPEVHIHIHKAD